MTSGLIANHLWQSTLFLAIAALLTLLLRKNRAQVRYALWLAASLKFLVPFAVLLALGSQFPLRSWMTPADSPVTFFFDAVSQPFSPSTPGGAAAASPIPRVAGLWPALPVVLLAVWFAGCAALLMTWLARWRRIAAAVQETTVVESGREWEILRRLEETCGAGAGLPLLASSTTIEPGVFGILRPVLLWPRSISARLSDEQIEAIFAHELAHVRRRDNLTAAVHMLVQAVFWFHPVVWWIGARLIDERERACDEEVIRAGSLPQVYAESILKTCEFYVESPLVCLSGVTGSDLKKRIEQIMRGDAGAALTAWRKVVLVALGIAALAGPIVAGALNAPLPAARAFRTASNYPTFAVASIKRSKELNAFGGMGLRTGEQFIATNITLQALIQNAYGLPLQPLLPSQLVGAPEWISAERFDIVAKAEGIPLPGPEGPLPLMIRALLAERFNLVVHDENRDLQIYALLPARDDGTIGPRVTPAAIDCSGRRRGSPPPPPAAPGERPPCGIRFLNGDIAAGGVTMAQFASALSRLSDRLVVDQTGLGGEFDLDLTWTPERRVIRAGGAAVQPRDVSPLVTAVQEQLGLRLDPQKSPVDVLVIDRVDRLNVEDDFVSPPPPPFPPPPPPPRQ